MSRQLLTLTLGTTLLFTGCTILKPNYDASNQKVLENTMTKIALGEALKDKLPSGSNVALRSMEKKKTLDEPVDSLIQDIAVRSLVNNGFRTLERDDDALANLQLEDNNRLKVEVQQHTIVDDLDVEKLQIDSMTNLIVPTETYVSSALRSADYILSYRVLEAGVTYHSLDDGFQWEDLQTSRWWLERFFPWVLVDEIERESMVRLHVRAIKTKTGEIVYADNLMSLQKDIIEKHLSDKLKDYHFDFFNPGLPVLEQSKKEEERSKELKNPVAIAPLAFIADIFAPNTNANEVKKEEHKNIKVDVLAGFDNSYALLAGYTLPFGTIEAMYHTVTKKSTTNIYLTNTYTNSSILYSYPISFINLHAGLNTVAGTTKDSLSGTTTTIASTQNFGFGASIVLVEFMNVSANYFYYTDTLQTISISAGLAF